jgi:hypothetical protein
MSWPDYDHRLAHWLHRASEEVRAADLRECANHMASSYLRIAHQAAIADDGTKVGVALETLHKYLTGTLMVRKDDRYGDCSEGG